jgi:hypothetical protein
METMNPYQTYNEVEGLNQKNSLYAIAAKPVDQNSRPSFTKDDIFSKDKSEVNPVYQHARSIFDYLK